MKDKMFGEFNECPKCHSDKGLYHFYEQKLDDNYCYLLNGKLRKLTKYQKTLYRCDICGWGSEPRMLQNELED